jgi:general secretion pathway protein J
MNAPLGPLRQLDRPRPFLWPRWRGFTLLELLVAISILSIVSMIAWRGLGSLVTTRERLDPERDEVRALLSTFGQLERDLAQIATPSVFGLSSAPVVVRLSNDGQVLQIVRIAPRDEVSATAIQTIYWRVADGVLLRQSTPPARDFAPVDAERLTNARLLTEVKAVKVRLWADGGWAEPAADGSVPIAPPVAGAPPPSSPIEAVRVPPGIEFTVVRNNGTQFRRVLLVG